MRGWRPTAGDFDRREFLKSGVALVSGTAIAGRVGAQDGGTTNVAFTLRQSTMLVLAGVAVAVAFRAGVFNIGMQGQFVVGGFATAVTVLFLAPILPEGAVGGVLLMWLGTLAVILAGGAYAALPGLVKAYADANKVIRPSCSTSSRRASSSSSLTSTSGLRARLRPTPRRSRGSASTPSR
nr:hypothetical protein [Halorussus pelagicus]